MPKEMIQRKNDGGSAFPDELDGGMTLRDYFAGQALAGICGDGIAGSHHVPVNTAKDAYTFADAMIAERAK